MFKKPSTQNNLKKENQKKTLKHSFSQPLLIHSSNSFNSKKNYIKKDYKEKIKFLSNHHTTNLSTPFHSMRNTFYSKNNFALSNTLLSFQSKNNSLKNIHKQVITNAKKSLHILDNNIFNPRKFGFSEYKSEFTLQHSNSCFSFSKAKRFKDEKVLNDNIYNILKTDRNKCFSFGKGKRIEIINLFSKNNPGPNHYKIKSIFNSSYNKGFTFHDNNRNIIIKDNNVPGPGKYNLNKKINSGKIPIIMKFRNKFFYDDLINQKKFTVSCQKYFPNIDYIKINRFKNINFGNSKRFIYHYISNPGPGSYNVPGNFDRGLKGKLVLN